MSQGTPTTLRCTTDTRERLNAAFASSKITKQETMIETLLDLWDIATDELKQKAILGITDDATDKAASAS